MENLTIREVREKAIKDAKWEIEYHTEKLEHAKLMLKIMTEKKVRL